MDKCKLIDNTLGLDDIVTNLPDNCETEIILKIKKENDKYGILSFKHKEELSDIITKVRVFDENGNEVDLFK